MNILRLSLANLRFRPLSNSFNMLILALGMALIVTLLQVGQQVEQRFEKDLRGIDLVVGAKGSPVQLILSSVFHLDFPPGNIPLEEAERLRKSPLIKSAIPLALGDNYRGFRIVGTTGDYPGHYAAELAEGRYWSGGMEAVLGSEVARSSGLKPGQTFAGSHGLTAGAEEHAESPYEVVGILKPTGTVIDRVVLTDLGSVWQIHEHQEGEEEAGEEHEHESPAGLDHDGEADHGEPGHADHEEVDHPEREITALLITYRTPAAVVTLPRLINRSSSMQAASPAFEMARLLKILGIGSNAIRLFATVLIVIAAVGFFVTLFNAVNDRRHDIALMRSLGATRGRVFAFVLAEGLTLGAFGTALGILLGHGLAWGAQCWLEQTRQMALNPVGFHPYEVYAAAIALGISALAAILPALMAYRINPAKVLSRGL